MTTTQPFTYYQLPRFSEIDPPTIESNTMTLLDSNRKKLQTLLSQPTPFTWANLMQPLEDMNDDLSKFWSPISHLHSVKESEALRKAYNASFPHLTTYHTELSQNENLFNAISSMANSKEFATLDTAQQKVIENDIRDFKLAGINLPADKKARVAELQLNLCNLMTKFSENVLDATQGYTIHITDKNVGRIA